MPAPGAVAARATYRQSDGLHIEQAAAVVPVGGQLVVLLASSFGADSFTRLAARLG